MSNKTEQVSVYLRRASEFGPWIECEAGTPDAVRFAAHPAPKTAALTEGDSSAEKVGGLCETCGGSKVDPGGLPICRDCDASAQFNGFDIAKLPAILISCVAKLWPRSNGLFWDLALEKMPGRIAELMARSVAAPVCQPDFAAIEGKRMSELTPAQQEDARELWLRNQFAWFGMRDYEAGTHIKFLLDRLDSARAIARHITGGADEA